MRTKEITIICITALIVIILICGTLIYINSTGTSNDKQKIDQMINSTNNNISQKNEFIDNQKTTPAVDDDTDGYIDGKKITYRNKNFLGPDSGLEEFSTNEQKYIKQKSTGRIAKRHLDDDGAYRYYDMQTGEYVLG